MSDYTKLVEALRSASTISTVWEKLMLDAAAAIEALMDAEKTYLAELAQCHENLRRAAETRRERDERIEALQSEVQELKRVNLEIFEDLPKLGEWEREMDVNDEPFYQCSVCGECFDFNRDSTHEVFKYCPNCGAKMTGEQDVE